MIVIRARNVNDAYIKGLRVIRNCARPRPSRAGDVLEVPEPVTTHYDRPTERVLFDSHRDANPFFHLFEALWMLEGRKDVAFLARFLPRMADYSDDGTSFHAAYGYRWRRHFGSDQLDRLVEHLRHNPESRQAVLTIWDPRVDLTTASRDIPCNDMVKFEVRDGRLNMVVFNRSNDVVWGCYGANVVQFSMLQEYMACRLGVAVGWYEQVSSNFHAYLSVWGDKGLQVYDPGDLACRYEVGAVEPFPLMVSDEDWDYDLYTLFQRFDAGQAVEPLAFREPFFRGVVAPMWAAWAAHRSRHRSAALTAAAEVVASDWREAALDWLTRRYVKP